VKVAPAKSPIGFLDFPLDTRKKFHDHPLILSSLPIEVVSIYIPSGKPLQFAIENGWILPEGKYH
jgi:hypothetical protein